MILTVDIGNTSINCGVFDGDTLVKKFRMPSDTELLVQDYSALLEKELSDVSLDGAIIASVVEELNNRVQYSILALYGVMAHILSHTSVVPVKLSTDNPSEIGADRIANSVRGYELYKDAVIVVDFGTATTFDVVNLRGEFVGGLIAPGVMTQLKSLNNNTSKLPEIIPDKVNGFIGHNTKDAILSGVVAGSAGMVDKMLDKTVKELGEPVKLIATGGYCELVSEYMETKFDMINPDITLEGLNSLFPANKPNQPIYKVK